MRSRLEGRHQDPVYRSQSTPCVLLDTELVIRATTPGYLATTGRTEDELVGAGIFEAFPENSEMREEGAGDLLVGELESVFRSGHPRHLATMRYDIPDATQPGNYLERHWVLFESAVVDDEGVAGVNVRLRDVTARQQDVARALDGYREVLAATGRDGASAPAPDERIDLVTTFLDVSVAHDELVSEVTQLREALTSRATIDQAKGIVMADRRCGPDDAFGVLRQISMDTNVRVTDVAAALVYQASAPVDQLT